MLRRERFVGEASLLDCEVVELKGGVDLKRRFAFVGVIFSWPRSSDLGLKLDPVKA